LPVLRQALLQAAAVDPVVFVVAAKEGQAGVVPEPLGLVVEFAPDQGAEILAVIWIGRTAEHHVLPDQDAGVVAGFVKSLLLVQAAAPNAQHVDVGQLRLANQRSILLRCHASIDRIGRDPVRPLAKHGHPVNNQAETAALILLAARVQPDLAQADRKRRKSNGPSAMDQIDCHRIKGLSAHPVGPPDLGVLHGQVERDVVGAGSQQQIGLDGDGLIVVAADADRGIGVSCGQQVEVVDFGDDAQVGLTAAVSMPDLACFDRNGPDRQRSVVLQPDRFDDAAGADARTPVPAIDIGRLAHERAALVAPFRAAVTGFGRDGEV